MEKNADGCEKRPTVGVGVMIQNEKGEILIGKRRGSHGAGEWSLPGGHLEFGETIYETAKREVKEETDLNINRFKLITVADEMRYIDSHGEHHLLIGVKGEYKGGEPKLMEPDKCEEWIWLDLKDLQENLFEATELIVDSYRQNKIYINENK